MDHKVQYLHRKYRVHCSAICASLKYLSEVMGFFQLGTPTIKTASNHNVVRSFKT